MKKRRPEIENDRSDVPFKVNMVYTNFPGPALVNNLNLMVTDPAGKRYCGNALTRTFDSSFLHRSLLLPLQNTT